MYTCNLHNIIHQSYLYWKMYVNHYTYNLVPRVDQQNMAPLSPPPYGGMVGFS